MQNNGKILNKCGSVKYCVFSNCRYCPHPLKESQCFRMGVFIETLHLFVLNALPQLYITLLCPAGIQQVTKSNSSSFTLSCLIFRWIFLSCICLILSTFCCNGTGLYSTFLTNMFHTIVANFLAVATMATRRPFLY